MSRTGSSSTATPGPVAWGFPAGRRSWIGRSAGPSVILREGLELVANRTRYSLRELVGTLLALRRPALRGEENLPAPERSVFCSALVQYLFRKSGMDLTPGVSDKHTTPEDLVRTTVPHATCLLQRELASGSAAGKECVARIKARLQKGQRRVGGTLSVIAGQRPPCRPQVPASHNILPDCVGRSCRPDGQPG
jgi:hypothetical protein